MAEHPTTDWTVAFHPEFVGEFRELDRHVKRRVGEVLDLLREMGPALGRPQVDTLAGSRYANMKELRVSTAGDWYRFAFAFDPKQQAIVLCGGGKAGGSQSRFYDALISKADIRFENWLETEGERR